MSTDSFHDDDGPANIRNRTARQLARWCEGRNAFIRIPFLAGFLYIFSHLIKDPAYQSIFGGLNLGIHELGHMVFSFMGEFIGIAGGTILQLAAPVYGMYNFYRQDDYFALVLCLGWLSTNFYNVAVYAADARAMELPLVSPFGGGHVYHDWNYLLATTGRLSWAEGIGGGFRFLGFLSMCATLAVGSWMVWQMIKGSKGRPTRRDDKI